MTTTTKPMNRTTAAQNAQLFAELNGWHPELIKAEVRMRGTNLTKLAIENGMHRTALTKAIYEPLTKGEKIIADFLGVSLHELWPDRYDREGFPLCHVRDQISGEQNDRHRQIGTAA